MVYKSWKYKYAYLPVNTLVEDTKFKRGAKRKGKKIAKKFDENKYDAITVAYAPEYGIFVIVDSFARFEAGKMLGFRSYPCRIADAETEEKQARIFAEQGDNRENLRPAQRFEALLVAKDQTIFMRYPNLLRRVWEIAIKSVQLSREKAQPSILTKR